MSTQNAQQKQKQQHSPFDATQRAAADASSSFDLTAAADIGVKVLVAAAAGTIIYNQFAKSDNK